MVSAQIVWAVAIRPLGEMSSLAEVHFSSSTAQKAISLAPAMPCIAMTDSHAETRA